MVVPHNDKTGVEGARGILDVGMLILTSSRKNEQQKYLMTSSRQYLPETTINESKLGICCHFSILKSQQSRPIKYPKAHGH